jgi:N,N-dimethylformamidase beta subunit-like, C-terminal
LSAVRGVIVVAAALLLAPAAHAASLQLSTTAFSPLAGPITMEGQIGTPRMLGVRLANAKGRPLGWLDQPQLRRDLLVVWDGRLDGKPLPDGYYDAQLVSGGAVVAATRFHLDTQPARLDKLTVTNGGRPFGGDGPLLATLTPNGDNSRDRAQIHFVLTEGAQVTLDVQRTTASIDSIYNRTWTLRAGEHTLTWTPAPGLAARTYVLSLTTQDLASNILTYGSPDPHVTRYPRAPVVRILGVDATFTKQTYLPGQVGALRISADTPKLQAQVFQTGPEHELTYADYLLAGVPVTDPVTMDWSSRRDAPHTINFQLGDWPSGLYYVKLTEPDGTFGYAPFVIRPVTLGAASRIAVVLPTNTWQAYNFYDADGNGWGDTWYVGPPQREVPLVRPYARRGVPPFFYRYDQGFMHWLYWTGKTVEFLTDEDVESTSGDDLARAYDLIVYPGHTEYVTELEYDAIERFRNLGGNLIFLSANNFFWKVVRANGVLTKVAMWRDIGRPEAALAGVQYLANDRGERQGVFVVQNNGTDWLWTGTDLAPGSTFGELVGGYGIEIDHVTSDSPPGTTVVAEIPDLFGQGLTAEMTYYETTNGAKVFAAGALDFGGSASTWPIRQMLENLWARLSVP